MENGNINPWLELWTRPRKTIRSILNTNPTKLIIWLAIAGGVTSMLAYAAMYSQSSMSRLQFTFLVIALVIIGAILGIIHLYFSGWLLKLTGSWIGGKGTFTDVKCAVGWSNYPFIIANLISIFSLFFPKAPWWILAIILIISFIISIWGFIIFLKLIGEAHQFSAWKALLAFLIYTVLILAALVLLVLLVPLLSPLFQ